MPPAPRRSLLFVPGSRPDRFVRALTSGADVVCVDLEDAVAPAGKDAARQAAIPFLGATEGSERVLRINAPRTMHGLRDLTALIDARPVGGTIFLPKVEHPRRRRALSRGRRRGMTPPTTSVRHQTREGEASSGRWRGRITARAASP